jgi:hypothetical protein
MYVLKLFPVFVLALCTGLLSCQAVVNSRVADFNHDGVIDTLAFLDDPDPCDYDFLMTFTDGKTGEKLGVPREEYCRCHIRSVVPIPPALWRPKNADVLGIIKKELLMEERSAPGPSFAWILQGLETRRTLTQHPYFELVIDPGVERQPGKVELPTTYSLPIKGKAYQHLFTTGYFSEEVAADKGFAIYYGHNHYQGRDHGADSVKLVASTTDVQVFRTSHGLFAQSLTQYHWLFVTDHALTGAPDKLRWASIGDVTIWENRLLILQHRKPVSSGTAVFVIDLKSGRTARLRHDLLGEPDDRITFSVDGDSLSLKATSPGDAERGEVDLVLSLEALDSALRGL